MGTPERILSAAAREFAERGVHGVRMDHVAKRAKVNRALVYRYFGDKDQLYTETLRRELAIRKALLPELPRDLEALLRFWSRRQARDEELVRLIAQEGLQDDGSEPVEAGARQAYYAEQVAMLRELQSAKLLRDDIDPEALFFALLMLTIGPVLLPQVMRLAMPGENRQDRWEDFLGDLAAALAEPAPDP